MSSLDFGFIAEWQLKPVGAITHVGDHRSSWFNLPRLNSALHDAAHIASNVLSDPSGNFLDLAFGNGSSSRIQSWVESYGVNDPVKLLEKLEVKISLVDDISGFATGAYSESLNTIFVSDSLVNNGSDQALVGVLVEELGHAIDAHINSTDSNGDEGEIFAALACKTDTLEIRAESFTEDDLGVLQFKASPVHVEFSNSVTVYEHADFKGKSKSFAIGNYSYIGNDFNDILTSIRIPQGSNLVVELFEHANFQGRSTVASYSQASIGADWNDWNWKTSHMNDLVSSLRVRYQRRDEIIFYKHANFQGLAHSDTLGSRSNVRFDNDYSSIDLPSNTEITVFEHPGFRGSSASYSKDVSFLGSLNDKVSSYNAMNPDNRDVKLSRVQGPDIIENKDTWIVIHGWRNGDGDSRDLANAIEEYDGVRGGGNQQVFVADWPGARTSNLKSAAACIDKVAEAIKAKLASWGVQGSNINLAGHSLGAYVAYEISERMGGINKLVALNPASSTLTGYDITQANFRRYSNWSWAFYHNQVLDHTLNSLTADESFRLTLTKDDWNVDKGHGSSRKLWANMLRDKKGAVSKWFGLNSIVSRSAPWSIDSGWEARIEVSENFTPTGRWWNA